MEQKKLKFNLQLFAEGEGAEGGEGVPAGEPKHVDYTPPETQAELDSIVGKAVNKALENERKKHASSVEQAVQEALAKEKDYSKLSEAERKRKEFEDEQAEFEARKREFNHQQLVVQIKGDLVDKGLPVAFADTLALHGDAEKALEAVGVLQKAFDEAVASQVKVALRQKTPSVAGATPQAQTNYGARLATTHGGQVRSDKII